MLCHLPGDFGLAAPCRHSDGQRSLSPAADNQDLHPGGWPAGYRVQNTGQVQRCVLVLIEEEITIKICSENRE